MLWCFFVEYLDWIVDLFEVQCLLYCVFVVDVCVVFVDVQQLYVVFVFVVFFELGVLGCGVCCCDLFVVVEGVYVSFC